jgi:hypothetical protein
MHFPLSLDITLNLLWVAIGLSCVAILARREFIRAEKSAKGILRRTVALSVLMIALFPSVSVSDDEISFWFLNPHSTPRGGMGVPVEEKEKSTQHLARLFDTFEHYQLPGLWFFNFTLFFLAFICLARQQGVERFLIHRAGRAPPIY